MPGRSAVGVAGQPRRSARLAGVGAGLGVVAAIALFTHSEVPAARVPDGFPPAHSPLARGEHPRLWVTADTLPGLRLKLSGEFRQEYQAFVSDVDRQLEPQDRRPKLPRRGRTPEAAEGHNQQQRSLNEDDLQEGEVLSGRRAREADALAMCAAFIYAVGDVPGIAYGRPLDEYARRARDLALTTFDARRAAIWPGLVYDWVHPILSPSDRRMLVERINRLDAEAPRVKDPWDDRSTELIQNRVLAGLAIWGDGVDDASAERLVGTYWTDVVGGGALDAANLIAADAGGSSEGLGYSAKGGGRSTLVNLLKIVEAWRTATGGDRREAYLGPAGAVFRGYPRWLAYLIRPKPESDRRGIEGLAWMAWKTHFSDAASPLKGTLPAVLSPLRLYSDLDPTVASLVAWLLDKRVGHLEPTGAARQAAVLGHFVLGRKGVPARAPRDLQLPLTQVFGGLGWVAMRSGWGDDGETLVTFTASPWWRSFYSNRNQNSFTIDRRGPLAINSGHRTHHDYANATWAHNTIIFPEAGRQPSDQDRSDLGGQRRSFKPAATDARMLQKGSMYDLGGLHRVQASDGATGLDFDYAFGDATRAYNGPANSDGVNHAKVKLFTRQLVSFRRATPSASDRLVVFDRTETTDGRFEKRWLLHPSTEPVVHGEGRQIRDGYWTYPGANRVTVTNTQSGSAGRLFLWSLLPESRRIAKIGGPGHEFEDPYGRNIPSRGFDPTDERAAQYVGTYRIEVIPNEPRLFEVFLHVLEAADAGVDAPTPVELVRGEGVVGAVIGDRVALFSTAEASLASTRVVIVRAGTYRVLFTDLEPRSPYTVFDGQSTRSLTSSEAGLIYLPVRSEGRLEISLRREGVPRPDPAR